MEACFIVILLICSFGLSLLSFEMKERRELSTKNRIEINCFTTSQDQNGNFPELKIKAKNFDDALATQRKYESMGWVVIMTITTKTGEKKKC